MNLLFLDQFSDLGGAQKNLLELLPAVRAAGWRALVGLPGEGELFQRVRALGFEAERIDCGPYASGRKSAADFGRFLAGTPRLAAQMRRLAQRVDADVVYLNGPRLLPAAALAQFERPVLFHSHSYLGPGPARSLADSCPAPAGRAPGSTMRIRRRALASLRPSGATLDNLQRSNRSTPRRAAFARRTAARRLHRPHRARKRPARIRRRRQTNPPGPSAMPVRHLRSAPLRRPRRRTLRRATPRRRRRPAPALRRLGRRYRNLPGAARSAPGALHRPRSHHASNPGSLRRRRAGNRLPLGRHPGSDRRRSHRPPGKHRGTNGANRHRPPHQRPRAACIPSPAPRTPPGKQRFTLDRYHHQILQAIEASA